jgi:hypothetical protein
VQLLVEWEAPSADLDVYGGDGGKPITQYLVEWDTDFANPPALEPVRAGERQRAQLGHRLAQHPDGQLGRAARAPRPPLREELQQVADAVKRAREGQSSSSSVSRAL